MSSTPLVLHDMSIQYWVFQVVIVSSNAILNLCIHVDRIDSTFDIKDYYEYTGCQKSSPLRLLITRERFKIILKYFV